MLGNSHNFWQRSFLSILSPQPLRPTTQISRLLCSSVVETSKICRGRSRNSSRVKSQGYFVSWRLFFQIDEQRAKFVNEVRHLTCFIEKVDSELPSSLMMLIRQLIKMKNGCELTKNRRNIKFQLLQFNKAKWEHHNDVSSKLEPRCFRTAALLMMMLNMESQKPMGRVYPENRSKTQKPLGVKESSKKTGGHVTSTLSWLPAGNA